MKRIKLPYQSSNLDDVFPVNSLAAHTIENLEICIARTKHGLYAFKNSCPHYSVPLTTGKLNYLGEIVCSLHGYRFNLQNGWEADGKDYCLEKFPIEQEGDDFYILIS